MTDFTLELKPRTATGKGASRRARAEGFVPANFYCAGKLGHGALVEERAFRQLAAKALPSQVFTFRGEGSELDGQRGIVKEVQLVSDSTVLLHVDFHLLEEGKPINVPVPLNITGEAPGVKKQGGVLTVQCQQIFVAALPDSIPSELEVSVATLNLGERIRTGDIELPAGVTLKSNPEETVANVVAGRAARLMSDDDASEEGAEAATEGADAEAQAAA